MALNNFVVMTHGGVGSKPEESDGTLLAAEKCAEALRKGTSLLESACAAVACLENDRRFVAGSGSYPRSDGSFQMDASCMDSEGTFGAVAALQGYKNPIHAALAVSKSRVRLLAGQGAGEFAAHHNLSPFKPGSGNPPSPSGTRDTVGCVAGDGKSFAAALSTGGIKNSLPGRVGDVPIIGCGLFAGPAGAAAATGDGEDLIMNMTAFRAYQMMERGISPEDIVKKILGQFEPSVDVGLILVTQKGYAGGANREMVYSALEG